VGCVGARGSPGRCDTGGGVMSANSSVLGPRSKGRLLAYLVPALLALALVLPGVALADSTTTVPFTTIVTNPCNGEPVVVTGYERIQYVLTVNTNTIHFDTHENTQGPVTGTSVNNPAIQYQVQIISQTSLNLAFDIPTNGAFETTREDRYEFIRQGEVTPQDDFFLYIKFHVTYSGQGADPKRIGSEDIQGRCR
jgi:hypothetical protein